MKINTYQYVLFFYSHFFPRIYPECGFFGRKEASCSRYQTLSCLYHVSDAFQRGAADFNGTGPYTVCLEIPVFFQPSVGRRVFAARAAAHHQKVFVCFFLTFREPFMSLMSSLVPLCSQWC